MEELRRDIILNDFMKWLRENTAMKQNSINQYVLQVKKFLDTYEEIELENLKKYLLSRKGDRIVYNRRFAIKKFLMFLKKEDWIKEIDKLRTYLRPQERRYERYIDFQTFKDMIEHFNDELKLIMMILYDTGMRISPIINLKIKMIKKDKDGTYIIGKEKRGKIAKRYLDPITANLLESFIKDKNQNDYVFRKIVKGRWETWWECYYRLWKELKIESRRFLGEYGISFHWVRTSGAKELYKRYKDLVMLKEFLAHNSIQTTTRYVESGELRSSEIIRNEKGKWR